uniref:Uncharacterized protein n=1 Tax=Salix viminalis TaxID=40686 RepID=A0A6N2LM03_SALVM
MVLVRRQCACHVQIGCSRQTLGFAGACPFASLPHPTLMRNRILLLILPRLLKLDRTFHPIVGSISVPQGGCNRKS